MESMFEGFNPSHRNGSLGTTIVNASCNLQFTLFELLINDARTGLQANEGHVDIIERLRGFCLNRVDPLGQGRDLLC